MRLKKVEDGCLIWTGGKNRNGYGYVSYEGKYWQTHRLAYLFAYGDFDLTLHVLHTCDNPPCCNWQHLFLGTNTDNVRDSYNKGRRGKITKEQATEIRLKFKQGIRQKALAQEYGLTWRYVGEICRGLFWTEDKFPSAVENPIDTSPLTL